MTPADTGRPSNPSTPAGLPAGQVESLAELVAYAPASVVSRTLVSGASGTVTLFAFDAGQSLSEHTAPFDALVHVLDGRAQVSLAGVEHAVATGQVLLIPAHVPHALRAGERFKMLLVMLRDKKA